ncbi:MAG: hypothetical protein V4564_22435 [Pseudomonadota bacterium]
MSLFPRIQSPCPYKGNLSDIMDGSLCRLCKREVYDLTALSDGERQALVNGCETEICVSYTVSTRSVLAAAAMGVAAMTTPAFAQQTPQAGPVAAALDDATEFSDIIVGGLRAPKQAQWVKDEPVSDAPALPVTYDDPAPAQGADQAVMSPAAVTPAAS